MATPASNQCFCTTCGYDLSGSPKDRCPECGTSPAQVGARRIVTWASWRRVFLVVVAHAIPVVVVLRLLAHARGDETIWMAFVIMPGEVALASLPFALALIGIGALRKDPARAQRLRWWSRELMWGVLVTSYSLLLLLVLGVLGVSLLR